MSIYSGFRVTAATLFDRFGVPATITSAGAKTRDKITGDVTSDPAKTKTVRAVLGAPETKTDDSVSKKTLKAKATGPAKAGDSFTIGGKSYKVVDADPFAPDGGAPFYWNLVLS